jgi:hypothetical protein
MSQVSNGIRKEVVKGQIVFDEAKGFYVSNEFQKAGSLTAQLRQTITTKAFYPSKQVDSDLQQNIFNAADFGYAENEYESVENRVAWLLVPSNYTVEGFKAKLAEAIAQGATIYKVLSNSPILDKNQLYAISQGQRTIDQYANQQVVRVPENKETIADGTAGTIVLDNAGNVQYRKTYFWGTPKADMDIRDINKVYVSPELQAELAGASVMEGQTL